MSPSVSLFGKRVLADVIKMRSYWNRVDLRFSKTGNLVKRGKCGHRHVEVRQYEERRGEDTCLQAKEGSLEPLLPSQL